MIHADVTVSRRVTGNNVEDITYVASGVLKKHVVAVDGYFVRGAPVGRTKKTDPPPAMQTLFDLRTGGAEGPGFGVAWIESEERFVFNVGDPHVFHVTDAQGGAVETRSIVDPDPVYWSDGIDYIPAKSTWFPDHILRTAYRAPAGAAAYNQLQVLTRDGHVVHEVVPVEQVRSVYIVSVSFRPPDRLRVVTLPEFGPPQGWLLDLTGAIAAGPVTLDVSVGEEAGTFVAIEGQPSVITRFTLPQ